tara:strand:+ start:2530 stop:3468 length:939 start_codon:yes stop_codon:yes gene_type:complete
MELYEEIYLKHFELREESAFFLGQEKYVSFDTKINHLNPLHKKVLIDEGIIIQKRSFQKRQYSKEKYLVLESHPDDFALSCAGFMLDEFENGARMTLLNIFSRGSLSTFPWNSRVNITEAEYEDLRLYESRTVAEYLGVEFRSQRRVLGLKRGHKTPFESLTERDSEVIEELAESLETEIRGHSSMLVPLGIQNHVDHLVVYEAALRCKKRNPSLRTLFYEDLPYARNRIAHRSRMDKVADQIDLKPIYVDVGAFIDIMADLASIYRSQFDDVNRIQRLALVQEYARTIAEEGKFDNQNRECEFAQRIFAEV